MNILSKILITTLFLSTASFAADKKISQTTAISQGSWAAGDLFPIVDISATETKNTSVADFDTRYSTQPAQVRYVAKHGSDSTGNGSVTKPYLTITFAQSTITDATLTKQYAIAIEPGIYQENTLNPIPNVWWVGMTGSGSTNRPVRIQSTASMTLDLDNASGTGSRQGYRNLSLAPTSFVVSRPTITGAGPITEISDCQLPAITLTGNAADLTQLQVRFDANTNIAAATIVSSTVYIRDVRITGAVAFSGNSLAHIDSTWIRSGGGSISSTGTSDLLEIYSSGFDGSTSVVGSTASSLSITGGSATLIIDAASYNSGSTGGSITIGGGVTTKLVSTVKSLAYTPTTSGDWPVVPTTALQGLDYLASSRSTAAKSNVVTSTDGNITLSGEQTHDGILTSASRVLVWQQTTGSENGIYVSSSGAWTRSTDMDSGVEITGAHVVIQQGTREGKVFVQTKLVNTVGSDNIQFVNSNIMLGSFDEQVSNATGASLVHNAFLSQNRLSFFAADATNPGMLNATTQTIGGAKTFSTSLQTANGKFGSSNFADNGAINMSNNTRLSFRNGANTGNYSLYLDGGDELQFEPVISSMENLKIVTVGKGLQVKTGTNAKIGVDTLVAGTVTVSNTSVTNNSRIFLSVSTTGGTQGILSYTKSAGSSFTINSTSVLDTSTIDWFIVESIP